MKDIPIYTTPDDMRIYAIGDVHGHADLLDKMHEAISADLLVGEPQQVHIVYLGDYIDRGPDSKGVIDRLISRRDRGDGIPKTFLKGNHENGFFEFMADPVGENFLKWGGVEMLASYGVTFEDVEEISPAEKERAAAEMLEIVPSAHMAFLEGLDLSLTLGGYFFAHAGVDPLKSFDEQSEQDLTFIRQPFLSWHENLVYKPLAQKVVHGHSVSKEPIVRPHRIGVDTGAYESGVLTAAVLEGEEVRFLSVSD